MSSGMALRLRHRMIQPSAERGQGPRRLAGGSDQGGQWDGACCGSDGVLAQGESIVSAQDTELAGHVGGSTTLSSAASAWADASRLARSGAAAAERGWAAGDEHSMRHSDSKAGGDDAGVCGILGDGADSRARDGSFSSALLSARSRVVATPVSSARSSVAGGDASGGGSRADATDSALRRSNLYTRPRIPCVKPFLHVLLFSPRWHLAVARRYKHSP